MISAEAGVSVITAIILSLFFFLFYISFNENIHKTKININAAELTCIENGSEAYSFDRNEVTCVNGSSYFYSKNR